MAFSLTQRDRGAGCPRRAAQREQHSGRQTRSPAILPPVASPRTPTSSHDFTGVPASHNFMSRVLGSGTFHLTARQRLPLVISQESLN